MQNYIMDNLLAMYVPVEVLESAPITTPPSKVTAIIVVYFAMK